VAGDELGAGEKVVQALGAEFRGLYVRFVAEREFLGDFGGAWSLPKGLFDFRWSAFQDGWRFALDDGDVAEEGFGGGEERQHRLRIAEKVWSVRWSLRTTMLRRSVWLTITGTPCPLFFVSVAAKELKLPLSPLDATHPMGSVKVIQ